jgi:adenylate cyclase
MDTMSKILIVDDEPDFELLVKQKMRRQIRDGYYEFVFAENGLQALEVLSAHPDIEIVLSDINMPGLDGLNLLSKVQETNPLIKTVIVSAYGDMSNIRTAMNRGAFDFLFKPIDFNDLETTLNKTLAHATQLRNTVQAIRENNILKMYVDESVLQFMSRAGREKLLFANETIEATVVFIDICGFTAISEKEAPDVVVSLLNRYFDAIVQEIIACGGYVDKFMGDAVMAVFQGENHLQRAAQASLAIQKSTTAIERLLVNRPEFTGQVSIGINSGEVVSGNIGSESLKRLDYTVIGDTVNLAQRLQAAAAPGQILVNEKCYENLRDHFTFDPLGSMQFKNKSAAQTVYCLQGHCVT